MQTALCCQHNRGETVNHYGVDYSGCIWLRWVFISERDDMDLYEVNVVSGSFIGHIEIGKV